MTGFRIPCRAAIGLAALALVLAACGSTGGTTPSPHGGGTNTPTGSASTPTSAGTSAPNATLTFAATVALTGESPVAGTYTDTTTVLKSAASSCMAYANNGLLGNGYVMPKPVDATPVGGQPLTVGILIVTSQFHGFGDYPASQLVMGIKVGNNTYSNVGSTNYSADLSETGDGGGTLTLTDLPNVAGSGSESGTITWTCQ